MNSTLDSAYELNGIIRLISVIIDIFEYLFSILNIVGILGNTWTISTLLIAGTGLKNFKVYFYVTFTVDFLVLSVFGVNIMLESLVPNKPLYPFIGLENLSNLSCKLTRYVIAIVPKAKYYLYNI